MILPMSILVAVSGLLLVAHVAFIAGIKRGKDEQRVADIEEQWDKMDRRNRCGRWRHLRRAAKQKARS